MSFIDVKMLQNDLLYIIIIVIVYYHHHYCKKIYRRNKVDRHM